MEFMHPWIKMSVKQEAEMCQTQASRPNNHVLWTQSSSIDFQETIKAVHKKSVARWWDPQAGRPRGGRPAPLCSVSSSSSRGSYVNRPSCVHPTPRPNTNL